MSLSELLHVMRSRRLKEGEEEGGGGGINYHTKGSRASGPEDLGVKDLLSCRNTREAFLQTCRLMYCEECALFILSVERARSQGMYDGSMPPEEVRNTLDRIYGDFIQKGAIYEIPIGAQFRHYVESVRDSKQKKNSPWKLFEPGKRGASVAPTPLDAIMEEVSGRGSISSSRRSSESTSFAFPSPLPSPLPISLGTLPQLIVGGNSNIDYPALQALLDAAVDEMDTILTEKVSVM